jgi:hypothetical protein
MRIVGRTLLLPRAFCRRLLVMYSSSWSGRKTHASWKNGLFVLPALVRRREKVGASPTMAAKAGWYWWIVISGELAASLGECLVAGT